MVATEKFAEKSEKNEDDGKDSLNPVVRSIGVGDLFNSDLYLQYSNVTNDYYYYYTYYFTLMSIIGVST